MCMDAGFLAQSPDADARSVSGVIDFMLSV
jgi:hypothetical protein